MAAFLAAGMSADAGGGRALSVSAGRGWTGMMKVLLEAGAHPGPLPGSVISPLSAAIIGDQERSVDVLLAAGADPDAADPRGTKPLLFVKDAGVARRLLEAGADPDAQDRLGVTALMAAVSLGDGDIVDVLLEAGADPDSSDRNGRSALLLATTHRFTSIRESLLAAGAAPLPSPWISRDVLQAYGGRYSGSGYLYIVESAPATGGLALIERGTTGLFENELVALSETTFYRANDPAALIFRFEVSDSGEVEGLWCQRGSAPIFVPRVSA